MVFLTCKLKPAQSAARSSFLVRIMKFPIPRCRFALGLLVLLSVAVTGSTAGNSSPNTSNFRVVLDSPRGNDKKTRLMLKNKIQSSAADIDLRAMVDRAKKEFKTISAKTKQIGAEARELVDKFKDNLQHYSTKELGIYAALTVALTVTMKNVVFSKSSSKTIDLGTLTTFLHLLLRLLPCESLHQLSN